MISAFYDLAVSPPTWDFSKFITRACMDRESTSEEIRVYIVPGPRNGFRDDDLPPDDTMRRRMLRHVVMRYCELLPNVSVVHCDDRIHAAKMLRAATRIFPAGYDTRAPLSTYNEMLLLDGWQRGRRFPRLRPSTIARELVDAYLGDTQPVVFVFRETSYWPQRNTDLATWSRFGQWLRTGGVEVVVVRDYSKEGEDFEDFLTLHEASSDIHILLALLKHAQLSYFVVNGPSVLALWGTTIPYRVFGWWYTISGRLAEGQQLPWASDDQRIIWDAPTFDALANSFKHHMEVTCQQKPIS